MTTREKLIEAINAKVYMDGSCESVELSDILEVVGRFFASEESVTVEKSGENDYYFYVTTSCKVCGCSFEEVIPRTLPKWDIENVSRYMENGAITLECYHIHRREIAAKIRELLEEKKP